MKLAILMLLISFSVSAEITSGTFCNKTSEVLWRCGELSSPGEGWSDQGKGCYHKDNGPSSACMPGPETAVIKPPAKSACTKGNFENSAKQMVSWECGCGKPDDNGWLDVGESCYHKITGAVIIPNEKPASCSSGVFINNDKKNVKWQCNCGKPEEKNWLDAGASCYHQIQEEPVATTCKKSLNPKDLNLQIEEFCVIFTGKGLPQNDPHHNDLVNFLKVKIIELKKLSSKLEKVKNHSSIWVTNANWQSSAIVSHFSREWLTNNKMNPEMALGIEITNSKNFIDWSNPKEQPLMLVHEAAHIYSYVFLQSKQEQLLKAYKNAVNAKTYDSVPSIYAQGKLKAYAMTNESEYFAELTEAYFGANDFYPFNREELKKHDIEGYNLLREIYE